MTPFNGIFLSCKTVGFLLLSSAGLCPLSTLQTSGKPPLTSILAKSCNESLVLGYARTLGLCRNSREGNDRHTFRLISAIGASPSFMSLCPASKPIEIERRMRRSINIDLNRATNYTSYIESVACAC